MSRKGSHRRPTHTSRALKKLRKLPGLRSLPALRSRGTSVPAAGGQGSKG